MTCTLDIIFVIVAIILFLSNDLISRIIILVIIILLLVLILPVMLTFVEKKNKKQQRKSEEKKHEEEDVGTIIGLDLGTTSSRVGVYKNGRMEIIENNHGNKVTPSCVAFTPDGQILIGDEAKSHSVGNAENTISNVLRLMGCQMTDPVIQDNIENFSFEIIEEDRQLFIKVHTTKGAKTFTPEMISAMIIYKMKEMAEERLGEKVTNAIVCVPANFHNAQKQAIETAVKISGLKLSKLISAPSAAAVAYVSDKQKRRPTWEKFCNYLRPSEREEKKTVLVLDLGGGHFDVSLISIDNGIYTVLSTHGNTHLGGEDFNNSIMNYFVKLYKQKTGRDTREDKKAVQKLRLKIEKAKIALSNCTKIRIVESLFEDNDFTVTLTRKMFEELNADLFMNILESVKRVLEDKKMQEKDIDDIVFAGGSSQIPKIQQIVRDFFKDKALYLINDEAVISGVTATTVLSGENTSAIKIQDVTPMSLGVQHGDGYMKIIIPKNTIIPAEEHVSTGTFADYQTNAIVTIYEGENTRTKDNHLLGEFNLTNIRCAPEGEVVIDITLKLDNNGILHVSAKEDGTDNQEQIRINYDHRRRSPQQIDNMIKEFNKYVEDSKMSR